MSLFRKKKDMFSQPEKLLAWAWRMRILDTNILDELQEKRLSGDLFAGLASSSPAPSADVPVATSAADEPVVSAQSGDPALVASNVDAPVAATKPSLRSTVRKMCESATSSVLQMFESATASGNGGSDAPQPSTTASGNGGSDASQPSTSALDPVNREGDLLATVHSVGDEEAPEE